MKIQLWSYNYEPEPTGIGPLSRTMARALSGRGHEVDVVSAHPHYPEARWGRSFKPYREKLDDLSVLRLPLWFGRESTFARLRQEATFTASLTLASSFLGTPDVMLVVSPSFPALAPAMVNARLRGIPWVLWLQDILPDGAIATDLMHEGAPISAARRFEKAAYRSASRVVVISDSFLENLRAKGVAGEKLVRIYNTATRPLLSSPRPRSEVDELSVITMGNIGHTQNLVGVVRAFEESSQLREMAARFALVGDGVAGAEVRAAITTDAVKVTGVVKTDDELEKYLMQAGVGVVSQRYEGIDFNVPSKLMNFMAYGIPVVAAVRPDSEVARIVREAGAGWVTDSGDLSGFTDVLIAALRDPAEREKRGQAGLDFARANFSAEVAACALEEVLVAATRTRAHLAESRAAGSG